MAQAKRRGNREDRIQQAVQDPQKVRPRLPQSITCNQCHATLTDIAELPANWIKGITLPGASVCPHCDSETYFLEGEPDAIEKFSLALSDEEGDLLVGSC